MKILFLGNNGLAAECIKKLLGKSFNIVGIVFNRSADNGDEWCCAIKREAKQKQIKIFKPQNINDDNFLPIVKRMKPNLIISVAYQQILKSQIIKMPSKGCINLHPAYLPKYRGKNPLNWVIINGERETGLTIHFIDEGVDTGNIILRKKIKISKKDTAKSLQDKFVKHGPDLLLKSVSLIKHGSAKTIAQDEKEASYYPPRKPEDGEVNWNKSAEEIYNLIRALAKPYPGAFSFYDGQKIFLWKAHISKRNFSGDNKAGKIIRILKNGRFYIRTGKGILFIKEFSFEKEDESLSLINGKYLVSKKINKT